MVQGSNHLKRVGGQFRVLKAQRRFSLSESAFSINTKETLAIWCSVGAFIPYFQGVYLLVCTDNTTALSNIKEFGGITSELHDKIATDVWALAQ